MGQLAEFIIRNHQNITRFYTTKNKETWKDEFDIEKFEKFPLYVILRNESLSHDDKVGEAAKILSNQASKDTSNQQPDQVENTTEIAEVYTPNPLLYGLKDWQLNAKQQEVIANVHKHFQEWVFGYTAHKGGKLLQMIMYGKEACLNSEERKPSLDKETPMIFTKEQEKLLADMGIFSLWDSIGDKWWDVFRFLFKYWWRSLDKWAVPITTAIYYLLSWSNWYADKVIQWISNRLASMNWNPKTDLTLITENSPQGWLAITFLACIIILRKWMNIQKSITERSDSMIKEVSRGIFWWILWVVLLVTGWTAEENTNPVTFREKIIDHLTKVPHWNALVFQICTLIMLFMATKHNLSAFTRMWQIFGRRP